MLFNKCFIITLVILILRAVTAIPADKQKSFQHNIQIEKYGSVDETFTSGSNLWLVHIKDAHCDYNAQKNSAKIMEKLIKDYGFSLVCVEGAASTIQTKDISSFPDKTSIRGVAEVLLKNGSINGAEYLSIINDKNININGIENKKSYMANYKEFYKSLSLRKKAGEITKNIEVFLSKIKPFYYSNSLQTIDNAQINYNKGKISVFELLSLINSYIKELNINYGTLKNTALLNKAHDLLKSIDMKKLDDEQSRIIEIALTYANDEGKKEIRKVSMKHKLNQIPAEEFNNFIITKCDEFLIEPEDFPIFSKYITYSRITAQINKKELISEINILFSQIKNKLYSNDESKIIDNIYELSQIMRQGFELSLPPCESSKLKDVFSQLDIAFLTGFIEKTKTKHNLEFKNIKTDLEFSRNILSYVVDFYKIAKERNDSIIENTIRSMKQKKLTRCILYSGGFHTDGITRILREKGISYSVISPNLGSIEKNSSYVKELTNIKNLFLRSLENNIVKQYNLSSKALALEPKLITPTEAIIDQIGAQAFRYQLKSFLVIDGIRNSIKQIDNNTLQTLIEANEEKLAELSNQIKLISIWKKNNFNELDGFAIKRNNEKGIDLELSINGEKYYVRNLIAPKDRENFYKSTYAIDNPDILTTLVINGRPASIYKSQYEGVLSMPDKNGQAAYNILTALIKAKAMDEQTILSLSGSPEESTIEIIESLGRQNILIKNSGNTYSINKDKLLAVSIVLDIFSKKSTGWVSLTELNSPKFPEKLNHFIEKYNISEIEIPQAISLNGLFFIFDSLSTDTILPYELQKSDGENIVFKIEKIIGSNNNRLTASIESDSEQVLRKERQTLLGDSYTSIVEDQLLGGQPSAQPAQVYVERPDEENIIELNNPKGIDTPKSEELSKEPITLLWENPELTNQFWREINRASIDFTTDNFNITGGLLFGIMVSDKYLIVTNIAPFEQSDLSYLSDKQLAVKEEAMKRLIGQYAVDGIKLIGAYKNHPPQKTFRTPQETIGINNMIEGYTFDGKNGDVIQNPIGIVFEAKIDTDTKQTEPVTIPSSSSRMYFYRQSENNFSIIHQIPAINAVSHDEKEFDIANRDLYLKRLKLKFKKEETIVSIRKTPQNRGFTIITHQAVNKNEIHFFAQFLRSIIKDLELYPDISEIRIISGAKKTAHINKLDNVIEFNLDLLNYPSILKFLALPHEINHSQLNYEKGLEEIIVIMLDLMRISSLAFTDSSKPIAFLNELEKYEDHTDGKQLFLSIARKVIDQTVRYKTQLTVESAFNLAKEYILSDTELRDISERLLSNKTTDYFVRVYNEALPKINQNIPPMLPGEKDYILFDPQTVGESMLPETNVINMSFIRIKYLDEKTFFEKRSEIETQYDLNYENILSCFDPRHKEIYVNIMNRLFATTDGYLDTTMILSEIIRQRTLFLLHTNQNVLQNLTYKIISNKSSQQLIAKYLIAMQKGKQISKITDIEINDLSQNPAFSVDGKIDFLKVIKAVIAMANGYNSIPHTLNRYNDIKDKLYTEKQPVPQYINKRIENLTNYIIERTAFLRFTEKIEKDILTMSPELENVFRIPYESTINILTLNNNGLLVPIEESPATILEKSIPQQEPKKEQLIEQPLPLTDKPIPFWRLNSFLAAYRLAKQSPPQIPVNYTKEIAYQNAVEFYEYLKDKYAKDPETALPEEIIVSDLFLGEPQYAKDFLDRFKQIDQKNIFYSRLVYNLIGHSAVSMSMLDKVKVSNIFKEHPYIVNFVMGFSLKEAEPICAKSMLIRSFGDTSFFENLYVISKEGDNFFDISFGASVVNAPFVNKFHLDKLKQLLSGESPINITVLSNIQPSAIDKISVEEIKTPIDLNKAPFGSYIRALSGYSGKNLFIFHPALINLIQTALYNMSLKHGGYVQLFGNTLTPIEPKASNPNIALTEMDSNLISMAIQPEGRLFIEKHQDYIKRKLKNMPLSVVIDIIKTMQPQALQEFIPVASFADLINAINIFKLIQTPEYSDNNEMNFRRFVKELKSKGYIQQNLHLPYKKDPSGKNDFLYSLTDAITKDFDSYSLSIAQAVINVALQKNIQSDSDFLSAFTSSKTIVSEKMLSSRYLDRLLKAMYSMAQNQPNFHLRAEVLPAQSVNIKQLRPKPRKPSVPDTAKVIKLTSVQFKDYLAELKREHPYLDFGDAKGIANPISGEIAINAEHPNHLHPNGTLNLAEYHKTITHEKAHMLIFSNWKLLANIASDLKKRDYEKEEILKLFFQFYFEEKVDKITTEHKNMLKTDPVWSVNGEISYERVLSELLAIINERQTLTNIMKRLSDIYTKKIIKGKTVSPIIQSAIDYITAYFRDKRSLIAETVTARTTLKMIDPRITNNFIFTPLQLQAQINTANMENILLPIPSAPIKTDFTIEELDKKITDTWQSIGSGSIEKGKKITMLNGLKVNDIESAINELNKLSDRQNQPLQNILASISSLLTEKLSNNKIYIYPTQPGSYTIAGTRFIHITENGDLIIPSEYYVFLKTTGLFTKAITIALASKANAKPDDLENIFGGKKISAVETELFDKYLRNKSFIPIIESILAVYGISISQISEKTIDNIIEKHNDLLKIPGLQPHLTKIKEAIEQKVSVEYSISPSTVLEAHFKSYLNPDEVSRVTSSLIEIEKMITVDNSNPIIYLIDANTITGPVSPLNFALRETLNRIRSEIEDLEKREVIIIAVNIDSKPVGQVKEILNNKLIRRGAATDDFDYVTSYKSTDDLLKAIKDEYPNLNEGLLQSSIKVLAIGNNPLITLAKENGFQYQQINEDKSRTQDSKGEGIFMIDYLRSLGLTNFLTEENAQSELLSGLRESIHIMEIPDFIDTAGIPENFITILKTFSGLFKSDGQKKTFEAIKDTALSKSPSLSPEELNYLIPIMRKQYYLLTATNILVKVQSDENSKANSLFLLYNKLKSAFSETTNPDYNNVTENFYLKLIGADLNLINTKNSVLAELSRLNKINQPLLENGLADLFLEVLIRKGVLTDSEHFILATKISSQNAITPVPYNKFIDAMKEAGVKPEPELNSNFIVETAPKKIQKELQSIITTQKLFDESA